MDELLRFLRRLIRELIRRLTGIPMGISSNAQRVQIQTAAKNGTLGTQGSLNANQVKFDTAITTNNGDLMTSPVFADRVVVLRQGGLDEEVNIITSVDVDGVTCTCHHDWNSAPANGNAYHVGYVMDDVATAPGASFNTTTREFEFDRKLQVGQNAAAFALLGIANGQRLRMSDEGAVTEALEVINGSHLSCGTGRGLDTTPGGTLIFSHDGNGEVCMQVRNNAVFCAYDSVFMSSRSAEGVNLEISVIAGGVLRWGDVSLVGITAPMTKRRALLKNLDNTSWITVKELNDNIPSINGWCKGDMDESVIDALAGEPDNAKVYIVVEDVDT